MEWSRGEKCRGKWCNYILVSKIISITKTLNKYFSVPLFICCSCLNIILLKLNAK